MNRLRHILLLASTLLLAACAGRDPLAQPDVARAENLPAPAQLAKATSGYLRVSGADFIYANGGVVSGSSLVLSYDQLTQAGGGAAATSDFLGGGMPFAVYVIEGVADQAVKLEVKTVAAGGVQYWLALADWRRGAWDYSAGEFGSSAHLALAELADGGDRFISEDGKLALAVLLWQASAELTIRHVEVAVVADVGELAASTDRWDGVQLSWLAPEGTHGFLVDRRPSGAAEDVWERLTGTPLGGYAEGYLDVAALETTAYEYRVQAGIQEIIGGLPRWFWSPGVTVEGLRLPTALSEQLGEAEPLAAYWPANFYSLLGFLYLPAAAPETLGGVRAFDNPPSGEWLAYDADTPNFGGFSLNPDPVLGIPFATHQHSTQNNPALVIAYSSADGTYAQLAAIDEQGTAAWEPPVLVRDAGQHVLGLVRLPRRIGVISWNPLLERIEMVDSQDMFGRYWFPHEPGERPDHVVGGRRPDGPVETCALTGGEYIVFREQDSGEVVVYRRVDVWADESPGLTAGPGATMRTVLNGASLPGEALVYLTDDGRRIRLLNRTIEGQWLLMEQTDLVVLPPGSTISEFKLLTSGEYSTLSYLLFVRDGNLYGSYCSSPQLNYWLAPLLIDDCGSVRDLDLIVVGTDEDWQSLRFVTYVSDNLEGVGQLRYRELNDLLLP